MKAPHPKSIAYACALVAVAPLSLWAADYEIGVANGLAEIIYSAEGCGFVLDEAAVETYYIKNSLDNPKALSHISSMVSIKGMDEPPTKTACTMARVTARSIGILNDE